MKFKYILFIVIYILLSFNNSFSYSDSVKNCIDLYNSCKYKESLDLLNKSYDILVNSSENKDELSVVIEYISKCSEAIENSGGVRGKPKDAAYFSQFPGDVKTYPSTGSSFTTDAAAPPAIAGKNLVDENKWGSSFIPPSAPEIYITDTGKKYHKTGCQYLDHSAHPIKLSDAEKQGYTPCSRCF